MNLTEVLLAVIITMAVIAGAYFLYTTVTEKNAMTQTMENISLLRANIEDIYDGAYDDDTFGTDDDGVDNGMQALGIIPQYFLSANAGEGGDTTYKLKTHWGPMIITVDDEDAARYTIELKGLSSDACVHFSRFQYKSWYKIEISGNPVWDRSVGDSSKATINDISGYCSAEGASVVFTAP